MGYTPCPPQGGNFKGFLLKETAWGGDYYADIKELQED